MKGFIDFHTHAFPDDLSERVIKMLSDEGGVSAHLNGKISSLLLSMDKCGIEKSVICSIATRPSQFEPILKWSKQIMSDRIIPFPSLHPGTPEAVEQVKQIKREEFKGVKFHPYYQDFSIDEKRLFPIYEELQKQGLIVVMHTGFDLAFERNRKCDPEKMTRRKSQPYTGLGLGMFPRRWP